MLVLRSLLLRPTFDSSFSDFDQMRREMDGGGVGSMQGTASMATASPPI